MDSGHSGDHPGPVKPAILIAAARSLVGVPFRHQGRNRSGLDCAGLIEYSLDIAGVPGDRSKTDYGRMQQGALLAYIEAHCSRIEEPICGSLLLFRWPGLPWPQHVALCDGINMIHAWNIKGEVAEHGYRGQWRVWTHSIWRIPGIDYR